MLTLYYAPHTCSLAAQIALEEAEIPHETRLLDMSRGEHRQPEYLALNPLGRVPALRLEDGSVLTEVAAILTYLAALVPQRELLPSSELGRARAAEWFSLLASTVHVSFAQFFRPSGTIQDAAAQGHLRGEALQRFHALLGSVDRKLPQSGYCLDDRFTLCDVHAFIFYRWGRAVQLPVAELPRYTRLAQQVTARPAVARVIERATQYAVPALPSIPAIGAR